MSRIGVNALFLLPGRVGGTEIYLRKLLRALAEIPSGHEFIVFTNRETDASLVPARFQQVRLPVSASSRPARILYEQFVLPFVACHCDVMLNPGFTSPLLAPFQNVTWIHDLQHKRHPEFFKASDLAAWKFLVWGSAKFSRTIMTLSEASAEDIEKFYGARNIHIAPPGVSAFHSERNPESMLLCVSTLHPHKNIVRLVDAFAEFHREHPEFRLVLAGLRGFHAEAIEERIAAKGLQDSIRITGWIPRAELLDLYRTAQSFIFPSRFEGFGIPIVEAMAAGIPVLCADARPMRDVAADGALLFDPNSTASLRTMLERIVFDEPLRAQLIENGRRRAACFTWRRTAEITLAALAE